MKHSIKDIVSADLCSGCGVCISESKSSSMVWNEDGFLVPDTSALFNEDAAKVCPYNPHPEVAVWDEDCLADLFLNNSDQRDDRIGRYINTYVGYSTAFRDSSSSGGIATYVFQQLLLNKIVDHLFVVVEVNGTYGYQWFSSLNDISKISKTRYYPVTMERLFIEIDGKEGKVAVSGIDSFIKAIRLKQYYYPKYREKISFLVGIICGGIKSRFFTEYLASKSGISGKFSSPEYRIKDHRSQALDYSFGAFDDSGVFHKLKMAKAGDMWGTAFFNSNSYDYIDDVTTELADISLGDAWIDPYKQDGRGTNIIITRSRAAESIIKTGQEIGDLNVEYLSIDEIIRSQSGGFNHKQKAIAFRSKRQWRKKKLLPNIRRRSLRAIPVEFKIVQRRRMKLREQSLKVWRQFSNSVLFDKTLEKSIFMLKIETRLYHEITRIRNRIKLLSK